MKSDGTFVIEIQYLINTLKDCTFDNIYHEHVNYWCLHSLKKYFNKFNFEICDAEKINTHGGSLRIYVKNKNKNNKINSSVNKILEEEKTFGILNYNIFIEFQRKVENIKNNVLKNIKDLKRKNKNIVGFGAPAKATTAINYFNIGDFFDYIIEDNKLKHNKYVPGTNIKILSKENIKYKINCLIVLAWNFFEEIKKNNKDICNNIISIKKLES
jgi:hypothetical protein